MRPSLELPKNRVEGGKPKKEKVEPCKPFFCLFFLGSLLKKNKATRRSIQKGKRKLRDRFLQEQQRDIKKRERRKDCG
jgi:hypothetical protein